MREVAILKCTLDTNCLIDLDLKRPNAKHLQGLVNAHRIGHANVAFVAVSASERQHGDKYFETYKDFEIRLEALGVADIPQVMGVAYFGISYFNHAVMVDPHCDLEERIHNALFPNFPFKYSDYLSENADALGDILKDKRWRNKWCDRQMMWAHLKNDRDVFVTSDRNFKKMKNTPEFGSVQVMTSADVAALTLTNPKPTARP